MVLTWAEIVAYIDEVGTHASSCVHILTAFLYDLRASQPCVLAGVKLSRHPEVNWYQACMQAFFSTCSS